MKAMIFGAGKIGRGLIAQILKMNNIEYTFVEIDNQLIKKIDELKEYRIHILGSKNKDITMKLPKVIDIRSTQKVCWELTDTDLVFTAVGGRNLINLGNYLGHIFENIIPHIDQSREINIITCENWKYLVTDITNGILSILSDENKIIFKDIVGVSEALSMSISAQPSVEQKQNEPLGIWMQDNWNLMVNKVRFKGDLPNLKGINFIDNFQRLLQQAMYTNNASSAVIAYLGYLKKYTYVADAANDREIENYLNEAYLEINEALIKELHAIPQQQIEFSKRAKQKYQDYMIVDFIERHAKDPIRKLGPDDRLVALAKIAMKNGVLPDAIALGIAAAIYYDNPKDPIAIQLKTMLSDKGPGFILKNICKIDERDELYNLVMSKIEFLSSKGYI
ncbi:MAG TPA: mannitol-1-phosphate 5-dehydrogenase [Clostridiaceae bacterium]|jgi:mannitol-1-phosphate 5-dehydrogenase|nr:mannitol-1-phosphate 5-dehydrogenase [Clostridiaceae bacterium]